MQRAKSLASDASSRSLDLAKEAAKFALQTAKRSHEIASHASQTAHQFTAFAGEIGPSLSTIVARSSQSVSASPAFSEQQLSEYGITQQLREFVHGLTSSTFQDFPAEDFELLPGENDLSSNETSNVRQDLTPWQERHALLMLKAVPEISQLRYLLCPRHMKESRFWKIYFVLVRSHVAQYEAQVVGHEDTVALEHNESVSTASVTAEESVEKPQTLSNTAEAPHQQVSVEDQELDAYLLGDLGSDADVEDDDFDADLIDL